MTTHNQTIHRSPTLTIYAHEDSHLSALALAMVGFADRVCLGPAATPQRRDLKASAAKIRLHVSMAGGASSARRRRSWYRRAHERVAAFAFAMLDLESNAQISPHDFDAGRALAARAKALIEAQLAALKAMPAEDQEDTGKLDELLLATDAATNARVDRDGELTPGRQAPRAPGKVLTERRSTTGATGASRRPRLASHPHHAPETSAIPDWRAEHP